MIKILVFGGVACFCAVAAHAQTPAVVTNVGAQRAVLDQYCVTCHNQRLKTAGLTLDQLDLAQIHDHADVWEKVVRKLRAGVMPPSGLPRPNAPVMHAVSAASLSSS